MFTLLDAKKTVLHFINKSKIETFNPSSLFYLNMIIVNWGKLIKKRAWPSGLVWGKTFFHCLNGLSSMLFAIDLLLHLISPSRCLFYHRLWNSSHSGYIICEWSFSHTFDKLIGKRYCLLVLVAAHLHQFYKRITFEATCNLRIMGTKKTYTFGVLDEIIENSFSNCHAIESWSTSSQLINYYEASLCCSWYYTFSLLELHIECGFTLQNSIRSSHTTEYLIIYGGLIL